MFIMITTRYVRENADPIRESLQRRGSAYPIDELLSLDREWRGLKTELQALQEERNRRGIEVSEMKKRGEGADKLR